MELSQDDIRVIAESLALFSESHPEIPKAASAAHNLALEIINGKEGLTAPELDFIISTLKVLRDYLDDALDDPSSDRTEALAEKKAVNAVLRKIRKSQKAPSQGHDPSDTPV